MVKRRHIFIVLAIITMKYITSSYDNKSVESTQTNSQSNPLIIDNNRQFITTSISPYCSVCGGTGRCGSCQG